MNPTIPDISKYLLACMRVSLPEDKNIVFGIGIIDKVLILMNEDDKLPDWIKYNIRLINGRYCKYCVEMYEILRYAHVNNIIVYVKKCNGFYINMHWDSARNIMTEIEPDLNKNLNFCSYFFPRIFIDNCKFMKRKMYCVVKK